MSLDWVARQITAVRDAPTSRRYNPRPPLLIHEGSATEAVLLFLVANPARFYTHDEIRRSVVRTKNAIDAALIFLRDNGLAEAVPRDPRNPRYLRYRASACAKTMFGLPPPRRIAQAA